MKRFLGLFCLAFLVLSTWSCRGVSESTGQTTNPSTCTSNQISEVDTRGLTYPVVDTNQMTFFDNRSIILEPLPGDDFYGQDAMYDGFQPAYLDHCDGTVTDLVTGLMWTDTADINQDGTIDVSDKMTYEAMRDYAEDLVYAGYDDWRLPSIKELYSLIDFTGLDPSGVVGDSTEGLVPFIDTDYFDFAYGDTAAGERLIDAQFVSSTVYTQSVPGLGLKVFGVNFADGRIKGYDTLGMDQTGKLFYAYFVRGVSTYGVNDLVDLSDGTILDQATGLMWMQTDSGYGMDWEDALAYANTMDYAGYQDWRLPNAKELQSLVDYTRNPETTFSPAIDPLFSLTSIINEAGQTDWGFYWTGTTHESAMGGERAVYIAFGRALGYMQETWIDIHGAGAQRSDPKSGDPGQYPYGFGPQGDAIRILNYVLLVRDQ